MIHEVDTTFNTGRAILTTPKKVTLTKTQRYETRCIYKKAIKYYKVNITS